MATYLGIIVERAVERTSLESAILSSEHVHLLASQEDLLSTSVGKLKCLVKNFCARNTLGLLEKSDLVQAIMSCSRFEEEHSESVAASTSTAAPSDGTSTMIGKIAEDLENALAASMQEADARAIAVNGPLSSAILRSRLVPDIIVVLEVDRTLRALSDTLLTCDRLADVRDALLRNGHKVELPSGAKIFVRPEQYESVIATIEDMDLKPRHIVVSQHLDNLVSGIISKIKRTTIKRRRITTTRPSLGSWKSVQVNVEVRRTFIHLTIPSSLPSGPSSKHAASV